MRVEYCSTMLSISSCGRLQTVSSLLPIDYPKGSHVLWSQGIIHCGLYVAQVLLRVAKRLKVRRHAGEVAGISSVGS